MSKVLELRRKKAGLVEQAKHLLASVDERGDAMTEQETRDYDGIMEQLESLDGDIQRREQLEQAEQALTGETRASRPDPAASLIGMSEKEKREWSMVRAIRAQYMARSGERNPWRGAELEFEASQAMAKRLGMEPQGFFVPQDVAMMSQRDLVVGTSTAGGHTVATDLLASSFIDILTNRMVLRQAGVTVLDGLQGNVAIPRQTGRATGYWLAESGAPTESQQTVDQLTLTPHTVGAYTDFSRRLILQSSISVENFVRTDLATVLQLAIDYAGLHGNDSVNANQPDGIASTSGIGSVAGGANGAAPDWADIVGLETEVAVDNADIGRMSYITNAKVRGKLKTTEKASGTAQYVWADGNTPLNGYPAYVTNQVSSTLTKGTSSGVCSAIFFGNWGDLVLGLWSGLDIMVDPYSGSTSGTMRVVALQDVDFGVRHAQSFAAMLDALTT